jgi:ATP-dependent DNA helicase 2 subunit 1
MSECDIEQYQITDIATRAHSFSLFLIRITEKITHTIAKDTGDILRTTGRGEGVKPVAMDRIFTYAEFGGERIPLTPTDVASIKAGSNAHKEASLALVGFKPLSDIPITFILEKSYFCYPNDDAVKGSTDAFANLHASMRRKNVVLIGELLSRATTNSRLVALIPQAERKDSEGDTVLAPGMIVVTLPFEDDVRAMEMDAGDTSTPALVEQAKGLLRALKLSDVEFGTDFENICLKRFWTYIEEAALGTTLPPKDCCDTEIDDDRLREILGEHISGFLSELPDDEKEARGTGTTRKRKVIAEDETGCDWVQLYTTDSLSECKVDELKNYLRSKGARVSGKKDDLVLRVSQSIGDRISKGEL